VRYIMPPHCAGPRSRRLAGKQASESRDCHRLAMLAT
jgi:hypothetical protein